MDILTFINSLTNEDLNRIRNSKSDAEARRLLREHQALQLQQTGVIVRSEQLKAVEKLKDFAYDVCPLHREEDLQEILSSL
jgi:hypothetical protein